MQASIRVTAFARKYDPKSPCAMRPEIICYLKDICLLNFSAVVFSINHNIICGIRVAHNDYAGWWSAKGALHGRLHTSEQLKVLVLLDDEKGAEATRDDLVKGKLIRLESIVFVSEAFETAPTEADIEDIIDPGPSHGVWATLLPFIVSWGCLESTSRC